MDYSRPFLERLTAFDHQVWGQEAAEAETRVGALALAKFNAPGLDFDDPLKGPRIEQAREAYRAASAHFYDTAYPASLTEDDRRIWEGFKKLPMSTDKNAGMARMTAGKRPISWAPDAVDWAAATRSAESNPLRLTSEGLQAAHERLQKHFRAAFGPALQAEHGAVELLRTEQRTAGMRHSRPSGSPARRGKRKCFTRWIRPWATSFAPLPWG